jgi:hypothetical protein
MAQGEDNNMEKEGEQDNSAVVGVAEQQVRPGLQ